MASGVVTPMLSLRVDIPKWKELKRDQSAKEVDNSMWGMEQYFGPMGIEDNETKVRTAIMYLTDVAMLWRAT